MKIVKIYHEDLIEAGFTETGDEDIAYKLAIFSEENIKDSVYSEKDLPFIFFSKTKRAFMLCHNEIIFKLRIYTVQDVKDFAETITTMQHVDFSDIKVDLYSI